MHVASRSFNVFCEFLFVVFPWFFHSFWKFHEIVCVVCGTTWMVLWEKSMLERWITFKF